MTRVCVIARQQKQGEAREISTGPVATSSVGPAAIDQRLEERRVIMKEGGKPRQQPSGPLVYIHKSMCDSAAAMGAERVTERLLYSSDRSARPSHPTLKPAATHGGGGV